MNPAVDPAIHAISIEAHVMISGVCVGCAYGVFIHNGEPSAKVRFLDSLAISDSLLICSSNVQDLYAVVISTDLFGEVK